LVAWRIPDRKISFVHDIFAMIPYYLVGGPSRLCKILPLLPVLIGLNRFFLTTWFL